MPRALVSLEQRPLLYLYYIQSAYLPARISLLLSSSLFCPVLPLDPAPAMDDRMSSFVVGSNYQVLDVIGEGAYGIVWYVPPVSSHPPLRTTF